MIKFLFRKLEGKVLRKPALVSEQSLVQRLCPDAVKHGQIGVEHHPFAANEENQLSNIFRLQDDRHKQSLSEIFSKGYEEIDFFGTQRLMLEGFIQGSFNLAS